jgi:hypothetical protein
MIGGFWPLLGRLSPLIRRIGLAALLFGAAVLAFVPTHQVGQRAHRPPPQATRIGTARGGRQRMSAVAAQLVHARRAVRTFLVGYLRLAYGRGSGSSVRAVTPALRRQLSREHDLVSPVERRRHPQVVSLAALRKAAGVVVATALIDDGGVASYAVRLTLRQEPAGWLVSGIDEE